MSFEKNSIEKYCTYIKRDGKQCKRRLSKKSKSSKCWQHHFSYNITIIPGFMKIKITIPRISIAIILIILIFLVVIYYPNIRDIWEDLRPPQKVIFSTDKFYQKNGELILDFSLINKDKKRTRIINDIQVDVLAFLEGFYAAASLREELKQTNFVIKLEENEKSSRMDEFDYEESYSILKEEKAYMLMPNEVFPLLAKFALNIDFPISEATVMFRINIFYQEPSLKRNIIYSDDVYFIKSTLNLWPKENENRFNIEFNRWNQKKFIEDNLNILKKESDVIFLNKKTFLEENQEILKKKLNALSSNFKIFIIALGKLNKKKTVPILIDSLKKYDEFNLFFHWIIYALGNSKDTRAIKPLIKIIENTDIQDEFAKLPAIHALAMIGDKSAIPTLQNLFEKVDSFYIKMRTVQALNKLGENYNLTDIVLDALNRDEPYALFFMNKYGYFDERFVDILIRKFQKAEDILSKFDYKNILEKFLYYESISDSSKNKIKKALSDYKSPFELKEKRPYSPGFLKFKNILGDNNDTG